MRASYHGQIQNTLWSETIEFVTMIGMGSLFKPKLSTTQSKGIVPLPKILVLLTVSVINCLQSLYCNIFQPTYYLF